MTLGDGTKALGTRPLMALLVDSDSNPSPIASFHGLDYYERLAFGDPAPPFSTDRPVNPASLSAHFRENSLGRFGYTRVGLFEVTMGSTVPDGVPSKRCRQVLGTFPPNMLAQHNIDVDTVLEESELSIVMVENFVGALPGNAFIEGFTLSGHSVPFLPDDIQVRVRLGGGGPRTPFFQLAHELSHLLRTIDMYNMGQQPNNGNLMMRLMSSYSFTSDDQGIVHLDLWHKMQLGWAEPRRFALKSDRTSRRMCATTLPTGPSSFGMRRGGTASTSWSSVAGPAARPGATTRTSPVTASASGGCRNRPRTGRSSRTCAHRTCRPASKGSDDRPRGLDDRPRRRPHWPGPTARRRT